jgi:hypothetical protein
LRRIELLHRRVGSEARKVDLFQRAATARKGATEWRRHNFSDMHDQTRTRQRSKCPFYVFPFQNVAKKQKFTTSAWLTLPKIKLFARRFTPGAAWTSALPLRPRPRSVREGSTPYACSWSVWPSIPRLYRHNPPVALRFDLLEHPWRVLLFAVALVDSICLELALT